jgi:hypothetical protein
MSTLHLAPETLLIIKETSSAQMLNKSFWGAPNNRSESLTKNKPSFNSNTLMVGWFWLVYYT